MTRYKNLVRGTAVAVGIVYSGVLFLAGIELDTLAKQFLAALPSLVALLVVVYDKWLWRSGLFRRFHRRPRIDGLWKGTLTPHPESHIPEQGSWGPIEVYVVIEQSFWTISITQFTEESRSYSRTSTFLAHGESSQRTLSFLYDNVPRQEHRVRSPRHVGACEFGTPQGTPSFLEGHYFTDRFTQGELQINLVDRSINFSDFPSAKAYASSVIR